MTNMDAAVTPEPVTRIPIRNIWFLLVYAWDLSSVRGHFDAAVEDLSDDAPLAALLANLLCMAVGRRLRQGLTRGYVRRHAVLSRVKGRIDMLETESKRLPASGRVSCRFEDMTTDTPRNRFIRAALEHIASTNVPPVLRTRCLGLSNELGIMGVRATRVATRSLAQEQFSRNDAQDRLILETARLAFEQVLPTEGPGTHRLGLAERSEAWLRHLFERAIGGFYRAHLLSACGWHVCSSRSLEWDTKDGTDGIRSLLPGMKTDITIDRDQHRLVVDTKFTDITQSNRWGNEIFKTSHLYQLYAYLRSQEGRGCANDDSASGMLLYPTIGAEVDEAVTVQSHRLHFATVDLAAIPICISARLLKLVTDAFPLAHQANIQGAN